MKYTGADIDMTYRDTVIHNSIVLIKSTDVPSFIHFIYFNFHCDCHIGINYVYRKLYTTSIRWKRLNY